MKKAVNYYAAAVIGLLALVALARWDLVLQAFHSTVAGLRHGGLRVQLHLLFEIGLFSGILLLTLRAIPVRAHPRRDAVVLLTGAVAGFLAEAWGTRTGLWTYYTGEKPPLWIVPVWPLGSLVIDRMTEKTRGLFKKHIGALSNADAAATGYWSIAILCLVVYCIFSLPASQYPSTWILGAALLAGFTVSARPKEDFWILLTGMFYVFFADLWGTTNNCWRYYLQSHSSPFRLLAGVSFGMLFDTAVILIILKISRKLIPFTPSSRK